MHSSFRSKPIPYSKLKTQQLRHDTSYDCVIPDQHEKNQVTKITKSNNMIFQQKQKEDKKYQMKNNPQQNSFNRTYSFGGNSSFGGTKFDSNKRLTHGLNSYKDIKLKYISNTATNNNNHSNTKSKQDSKNKTKCKIDLQTVNKSISKSDRQSIQCTFTPKTNRNKQPYKNFQDFVHFQQKFLLKKQKKINKLKEQKNNKQKSEILGVPRIDRKSKKMSQSNQSYRIDSQGSLKKVNKRAPVHQRLYNQPRKVDRVPQQQTFTPKILNKSKSLVRNDRVEVLLYEDAQRRKEQQQVLKCQQLKKQLIISAQSKYITSSYQSTMKQIKTKNKLICNKMRTQFLQLLQNQTEIYQDDQQQNNIVSEDALISPILAVTILSQLFNVQLNPNKNQQICWKIIGYLVSQVSSDSKQTCCNQYVQARKLWEFIKAIIAGLDGFERQPTTFTQQEIININKQLGYFYSMRLSKQPQRISQVEQKQQYRIQTSKTTNRLAEVHRAKKLEQISQFISETNIEFINTMFNRKNKANLTQDQQKIIRLEDLFILDSIRKKTQLQQKRLKNQQQEMKNYSFRPSLNPKSLQKAEERRSKSRERLKTIDQCVSQTIKQNSRASEKQNNKLIQQKKTIIKMSKQQKVLSSIPPENVNIVKKSQSSTKKNVCGAIKNVDKILLRQNIARKMKQVQTAQKQRGYNYNSKNWLKQVQNKRKQICEQVSIFQGYKESNTEKQPSKANKLRQNSQSFSFK